MSHGRDSENVLVASVHAKEDTDATNLFEAHDLKGEQVRLIESGESQTINKKTEDRHR